MASALKSLVRRALGAVVRIYFRDVEVVGAPSREVKGRLFAANHVNGIVDPLVILTGTKCDISPVAKSTLWKVPVFNWLLDVAEAVPVTRKRDDPNKAQGSNEAVFDKVAAHLGGGGNILIFPEGTSHNEPHVLELKSGAARMLARAKELGHEGLTVQAVALEWDARDKFRSRALVLYGPVRAVDELVDGAADPAAAIMDVVRDDLTELVVEGDTWEERLLIRRVTELLVNDAGDTSLARQNELGRRVEAAKKRLTRDHALYERVQRAVSAYFDGLASLGLTDADVVAGRSERKRDAALALLLLPLAVVGTLLYFVPYRLPRLAERMAKTEIDVVSTYKLGIGLLAFPAWAAGLVTAALVALPSPASWGAAALALASPFAALHHLDRREHRPRRRRMELDDARLRDLRREAQAAVQAARAAAEPA